MTGKINRIFGNLNPLFNGGKKVESEDTQSASKKENVPVGQTQATDNAKQITRANLGDDPNGLYSLAGLNIGNIVDTSEVAVFNRVTDGFKSAEAFDMKREFGLPAEIEGLDEAIAAQLNSTTLAYIAKIPANRAEKIGQGTIADFDKLTQIA